MDHANHGWEFSYLNVRMIAQGRLDYLKLRPILQIASQKKYLL